MTKVSKVQNLRCPEDYTRTLQAVMMPGCSHVFREKIIKSLFPDFSQNQKGFGCIGAAVLLILSPKELI